VLGRQPASVDEEAGSLLVLGLVDLRLAHQGDAELGHRAARHRIHEQVARSVSSDSVDDGDPQLHESLPCSHSIATTAERSELVHRVHRVDLPRPTFRLA